MKTDQTKADRNSVEAIKERLGAAYFLQVLLQEEEAEEKARQAAASKCEPSHDNQ